MSKKTVVLKRGESIDFGGVKLCVAKCGMQSQGGEPAIPSVTIELDDGEPEELDDTDDDDSGEGGNNES